MKLDRTLFWAGKFEDNEARIKTEVQNMTARQRLESAAYLNSVCYNFDINNPPKMDRTVFSMRKNG
jgi:hypothetical protein